MIPVVSVACQVLRHKVAAGLGAPILGSGFQPVRVRLESARNKPSQIPVCNVCPWSGHCRRTPDCRFMMWPLPGGGNCPKSHQLVDIHPVLQPDRRVEAAQWKQQALDVFARTVDVCLRGPWPAAPTCPDGHPWTQKLETAWLFDIILGRREASYDPLSQRILCSAKLLGSGLRLKI